MNGAAEAAQAVVHPVLFKDAVVYLAAAVALVPLFHRLKLGAVLGYLMAGVLIGPSALGLIGNAETTMAFAEFGIVLLLFVVGLELRPARLWQLRRDIFGLGMLQVIVTGLALTGMVLLVTSLSWQAALVAGLPLALSSTALVVQLLQERGALDTPLGVRSFAVLLFQDLAIVPLLTVVAALSRVPDATARPGWLTGLLTIAAAAGLALAGRFLLRPLFRMLAVIGVREVFAAAALLTVLGAAYVMAALDLSMALGAFVAGVMLAESPYRHQLEADIEPFRGLLLGLFFISVGMTLDLRVVMASIGQILLLVVGLVIVKAAVIALLARLFGASTDSALRTGLLLAQGGEFAFLLFGAAKRGLLLAPEAASLFGAVVTLSMLVTPLIVKLAASLTRASEAPRDLTSPEAAERRDVIIVGYGRFGQAVNQMLAARGIAVTLIDLKPSQIELVSAFGATVYYGDGKRIDVLRAAGAERAELIVFCIDGMWLNTAPLEAVRSAFPNARILMRSFDRRDWLALRRAGIEVVVRELFDSAVRMGREALRAMGTDDQTIASIEDEYRRRDAERLSLQITTGDLMSGRDMIFRSDRPMINDAIGEIPFVDDEPRV